MHDIQAHLRFLPMSAQKVRLVVDLVRGKDANDALEMLRFVNKARRCRFASCWLRLSQMPKRTSVSAAMTCIVAKIFADEAPTRKWRRFGARGRFKPILRRNSHVTVVLRERGS